MLSRKVVAELLPRAFTAPLSRKIHTVPPQVTYIDPTHLPPEKSNVFRKRPVTMNYNTPDFATFYLPSERNYFYSGTHFFFCWSSSHYTKNVAFDPVKVFGAVHGSTESPHIKKQVGLDSALCLGFILFNVLLLVVETKSIREREAHGFRTVNANSQKIELKDLIQ